MKKLKKFAGLILALVMVCAMGITAFAEGETTYTITIKNAADGYVYKAYQIFDGDLSTDGKNVLSNITWGSAIVKTEELDNQSNALNAVKDITIGEGENAKKPFADCTSAADIANVLSGYVDEDEDNVVQKFADVISNYVTVVAATSGTYSTSDETYAISGLDAGYYFVKTTEIPEYGAHTSYILTVVVDSEVTTKSDIPTVDKAVSDVDASIGDTITYTLSATLPSAYEYYETYKLVFYDTMSAGLGYNNGSVIVTVYNDAEAYYAATTTDEKSQLTHYVVDTNGYSVSSGSYSKENDEYDGGTTIDITISDTNKLTTTDSEQQTTSIIVTSSSLIEVTFTADLNDKAVIGDAGNPNKVYLEYSNNPNSGGSGDTGTTPEDKVVTWTFELDVTKTDKSDDSRLSGAEFVLYSGTASNPNYVKLDSNQKVTGWTTSLDEATRMTSDTNGNFSVIGLDQGTYYLKETTAPTGYNKLSSDVKIVISATYYRDDNGTRTDDDITLSTLTVKVDDGEAANGNTTTGAVSATVQNSKGSNLPETGGIGTTIFYVIGTALILGAAVLLVTRRRMGTME